MSSRQESTRRYKVGNRWVTVKVMDSIGPEDIYENQLKAVLHRVATGEDLFRVAPREAKDWMIKLNLKI